MSLWDKHEKLSKAEMKRIREDLHLYFLIQSAKLEHEKEMRMKEKRSE